MLFSVVIPTYNEERDIKRTLDRCLSLVGDFEIVVVDDSTDSTPTIVASYNDARIRLIVPQERGGRCEARNRGIMEARGDVVVILNADVLLPVDFLTLLTQHYLEGADYVLVGARVENTESVFARYVSCAESIQPYAGKPDLIDWTEGFSVRRELAIAAGLFPTGFPVRLVAGEDGYFGKNLRLLGALRCYDDSILVTHVCPDHIQEFWTIRRGRGEGIPQIGVFLSGRSLWWILWRDLVSIGWDIIRVASIVPVTRIAWRMTEESPMGRSDLIPFTGTWIVDRAAKHVGVWKSALLISKVRQSRRSPLP